MKFNIVPDTKKALQKGFITLLVILAFLGGVFVAKLYFDRLVGQKNDEYSKELTTLQEQIVRKETTHTKEISLLKSEYEKSLRQKIVREIAKDGSSKETIETAVNERKVDVIEKEVIVEKEKLVYVDRVVAKEIENVVIANNIKHWSLGFAIEPQLSVPYFDSFSLDIGYSLGSNVEVFAGYSNNLKFNEPSYKVGVRVKF